MLAQTLSLSLNLMLAPPLLRMRAYIRRLTWGYLGLH